MPRGRTSGRRKSAAEQALGDTFPGKPDKELDAYRQAVEQEAVIWRRWISSAAGQMPQGKAGRPPDIDPVKAADIISHVANYCTFAEACFLAKVPYGTANYWRRQGEKPNPKPLYAAFVAGLKDAMLMLSVKHRQGLRRIANTGTGNLAAHKYLGEMSLPEQYAAKGPAGLADIAALPVFLGKLYAGLAEIPGAQEALAKVAEQALRDDAAEKAKLGGQ